ncbi:hypothetical protein JSO59_010000 [Riemerella anatipestifer]|uniref:hypothetical protein n=1 Tax=Riemerella anatipestifer TaxID=34085 RepID=UPI0030C5F048
MKTIKILSVLLLGTLSTQMFGQKTAEAFVDKWKTQEEKAIINIVNKNGKILGYDPAGKIAIQNFRLEDGKWKASLYDSKKDMSAEGEVYLQGNKLKIIARKAFLTKTMYWDKN